MKLQGRDIELNIGDVVSIVFYNYATVTMERLSNMQFDVSYGIEGKKKMQVKSDKDMQSVLDFFGEKNGKIQRISASRGNSAKFKDIAEMMVNN